MQKQEIISVLNEVRNSHIAWIKQGELLLDGVNLDKLEEPVGYSECEFSQWCESSTDKLSAFSWFKNLQQAHETLHQSYSDMFFGSMRKYKPKTINELTDDFELLKSESKAFKESLDNVESKLYKMSDDSFDELVAKSTSANHNDLATKSETHVSDTTEKEDLEDKEIDDNQKMQSIDINRYDSYRNPFDELESIIANTTTPQNVSVIENAKVEDAETDNDALEVNIESKEVDSVIKLSVNGNRQISLKEQNIIQLKQEKEFSNLELAHLEETQKLTQQSVEQLEQYYVLKQQEIELEQTDNGGFIEFKATAKKQAEIKLKEIEETKSELKKEITELEKKNVEDQLEEDDKKEVSIEKQFEELKLNKAKNLKELQEHKKSRKNDLIELKEQVLLLEEEILDMEQDLDRKQQDVLDLEEKEQLKNEERSIQRTEKEKIQQERNDSIIGMQKELDQLSDHEQIKQNELDTINFQVEELNKNNSSMVETNAEELKDLEAKQEQKREKLLETENLKSEKLEEIKDIEIRIVGAERSLADLKADQAETEQTEQTEQELETT